jgi:hypothetical protein
LSRRKCQFVHAQSAASQPNAVQIVGEDLMMETMDSRSIAAHVSVRLPGVGTRECPTARCIGCLLKTASSLINSQTAVIERQGQKRSTQWHEWIASWKVNQDFQCVTDADSA